MRVKQHILFLITTCFCVFFATHASYASTPFSKYGVIQNVQNYSTNPFWNPNSPYNQRMPQPVYVKGPQVTTPDCQQTVASLVMSHCSALNNCANAQLTDIRPAIMVMLSRMPNGNYATSCGGYIDEAFNNFKAQYAPKIVHSGTAFPSAQNNATITIDTTPKTPTWATEVAERRQELEQLQTENGTNDFYIAATGFPTTYADLSFDERMANEADGYEPYKDMRAYQEIKIEDLDKYYERQEDVAQAKKEYEESMAELEKAEKCRKNPLDLACPEGQEKARQEKCSKKENYGFPECAKELEAYCITHRTDTQLCGGNNNDNENDDEENTDEENTGGEEELDENEIPAEALQASLKWVYL